MLSRRFVRAHLPLATAALLTSSLALLAGCTSDDEDNGPLLPLAGEYEGKIYQELMADWVVWASNYAPNEDEALDCASPIADRTGAWCTYNQDPQAPVFFLAGTFGEEAERDCTAPAGKALFFPLMNTWGDNAGVAEDMLLSQDDIRAYVEMVVDGTDPERVWLRVDGVDIDNAAQGLVLSTPYTVEYPEGEDSNTCNGIITPDVVGPFDGWVGGYWALLEPLAEGTHTVEFGLERGIDPLTGDSLELSVTYNLTVE